MDDLDKVPSFVAEPHLRRAKEGVDDWDKSASSVGNANPRRSTSSLEDVVMELSVRIRLGLAAAVLAVVYYYLLIYLIGWSPLLQWPAWWIRAFPTRQIAIVIWLVSVHTLAVLSAAFPVALASVVIARNRAALLGAVAAVLATAWAILPSLSPTIWPLIWNNHPVYFITDQIKLLVAVPFLVWVIRRFEARPLTIGSSDRGSRLR
jgi:hypothetical protein